MSFFFFNMLSVQRHPHALADTNMWFVLKFENPWVFNNFLKQRCRFPMDVQWGRTKGQKSRATHRFSKFEMRDSSRIGWLNGMCWWKWRQHQQTQCQPFFLQTSQLEKCSQTFWKRCPFEFLKIQLCASFFSLLKTMGAEHDAKKSMTMHTLLALALCFQQMGDWSFLSR